MSQAVTQFVQGTTPSAPAPQPSGNTLTSMPTDQIVTVPVGPGGTIVIPGQQNRGQDLHLPGNSDGNLSMDDIGDPEGIIPEPKPPVAPPVAPAPGQPSEQPSVAKPSHTTTEQQPPATQQQPLAQPAQRPTFEPHPDHAKQPRDYSGFDDGDAQALRAAPNNVFNHFKTRLPALKAELVKAQTQYNELLKSNGIPSSFHEHPDAFRLTKQYREKEALFGQVAFEEDFYARQLESLRAGGKTIKRIVQFDANGQPVTTDIAVDENNSKEWEDKIVRALGMLGEKKVAVIQESRALEQSFNQRRSNLVNIVREGTKKYFPFYEPDHPQFTKETGEGIQRIIQSLPPELQGSLLAEPLAKAYYMCLELAQTVRQMKQNSVPTSTSNVAGRPSATPPNGEQQRAETSIPSAAGSANGAGGGDEMLRMSDFGEPAV